MTISLENIYKGIRYLKHYGFKEFIIRLREKNEESKNIAYMDWYDSHRVTNEEKAIQKKAVYEKKPMISILVPTFNTPEKFLKEMIDSVLEQTYDNWELCIADASPSGGSQNMTIKQIVGDYSDDRIRYQRLDDNYGIAENTNRALEMASGEYIGFLDHDDLLEPNALYEVITALLSGADFVYTDEDKVLEDLSEYYAPHFKPDFSIDLLRSNNYITHFTVVSRKLVTQVGGFRKEFDGAQDYDFVFRCVEKAEKITHIPKVLYHWRMHQNSTAANQQSKSYAFDAGVRVVQAHLDRVGVVAKAETTQNLGFYRVKYEISGKPLVSIIIPNKDNIDSLDMCLKSIENSSYTNYEIIIVENNSEEEATFEYYKTLPEKIKLVTWKSNGVFNYSAINNYGAKFAKGEYLVLLNNDIEILTEGWLEEMISTCQRKEVGIVGVRLFYPDDTIQHAGIVVGIGGHARGIASNMFVGLRKSKDGYLHKSAIQLNYSAVTAACLMVKRNVFDEVNGLTEKLAVAFNDVDFCLKVREKNYLVCYNPYVVAYHYESKSRGAEDSEEKKKRFHGEIDYMREHWKEILMKGDPYYNPNFSRVKNDYSL